MNNNSEPTGPAQLGTGYATHASDLHDPVAWHRDHAHSVRFGQSAVERQAPVG